MSYRSYYSADRFSNYTEMAARFDSVGACGHAIKTGDRIGWNRRVRKAQCAACWARWVAENHEADILESRFEPEGGGW